MGDFTQSYVHETIEVLRALDTEAVDRVAAGLAEVSARGGRLFIVGVGGSAGHRSLAPLRRWPRTARSRA